MSKRKHTSQTGGAGRRGDESERPSLPWWRDQRVWIAAVVSAAVTAAVLLLPGGRGRRDTGPIRVGAALPLTGPLALFGEPERAALLQAVESINGGDGGAESGVRGRRIELVIEDTAGSARDGVSAVQKLMLQEPAAVITSLTIVSNATQQILEEEKTPQIALSVHPTIADNHPYTVRPYYGFDQEMRVLAEYFRARGLKRIAVLWVLVPECEAAIDGVLRPAVKQSGAEIVASESYNFTDTSVRPQLTKIGAASPEAVLVLDFGNLFGLILREAQSLGLRERVVGNIGLLTAPPIDQKLLEDVPFTGPSFVIENSPRYRQFADEFERRTGARPTYDALYTRDAFDILVRALREEANAGGPINTERLGQRLRNLGRHDGLTGTMEIRDGRASVGIRMGVYQGGSIRPLP